MTTEPQSQQSNIDGNQEYEAALDTLFAQSGRMLRIFDRALSGAYNVPRRHELLRSFLLANRGARIQIVVHDASNLARDCPRLMNLVRDFSHAISSLSDFAGTPFLLTTTMGLLGSSTTGSRSATRS